MDGDANIKESIWLSWEKLEDNQVFGRKDIMSITGLSINPAGTLIHKLLDMNFIVPVDGKGKGKENIFLRYQRSSLFFVTSKVVMFLSVRNNQTYQREFF